MTAAGDDKTDQASGVKSEPYVAESPIPAPPPRSADISRGRRMMFIALLGFAFFSPWSIAGAQMCLGLGLLSWAVSLFLPSRRRVILSSLIWPVAVYLGIQFLSGSVEVWGTWTAVRIIAGQITSQTYVLN